ncbi:MAG: hypothetical protein AAB222_03885, partial [Candidatus Binatota bacterium]
MIFLSRLLTLLLLSLLVSFPIQLRIREASAAEEPLPLLSGLEEAVEFWKLAFTRYSGSELIFHDPLEPMRIYRVLGVGPGSPPPRLIEEEKEKILREYGLERNEKRVRVQRGLKERFASG